MLSQERLPIIMDMLRTSSTGFIKISEISEHFGISNLTARRDLDILQDQNLIQRVYGGAKLSESVPVSLTHNYRFQESVEAAQREIGRLAASTVQDGDIIFMGSGTTVFSMTPFLKERSSITIITCSLAVINAMASGNNTVYFLGGKLDTSEHSTTGPFTSSMLSSFNANKAYIGCGGVSIQRGISDYSVDSAETDRLMVENSTHSYLLCSGKKFRSNALAIACPVNKINTVITDSNLDSENLQMLHMMNIEVLQTGRP